MPRRAVLNRAERQSFETPPLFKTAERLRAFDLPSELLEKAKALRQPAHQIGFVVNCAYFSTSKRFFPPRGWLAPDIRHAARLLDLPDGFATNEYSDRTRQRHERLILRFYGYRRFDGKADAFLSREIAAMAAAHLKPHTTFPTASSKMPSGWPSPFRCP